MQCTVKDRDKHTKNIHKGHDCFDLKTELEVWIRESQRLTLKAMIEQGVDETRHHQHNPRSLFLWGPGARTCNSQVVTVPPPLSLCISTVHMDRRILYMYSNNMHMRVVWTAVRISVQEERKKTLWHGIGTGTVLHLYKPGGYHDNRKLEGKSWELSLFFFFSF